MLEPLHDVSSGYDNRDDSTNDVIIMTRWPDMTTSDERCYLHSRELGSVYRTVLKMELIEENGTPDQQGFFFCSVLLQVLCRVECKPNDLSLMLPRCTAGERTPYEDDD